MGGVDDEEEVMDLEYEGRVQRSGQTDKTSDSRCMDAKALHQAANEQRPFFLSRLRLSITFEHHLISTPPR